MKRNHLYQKSSSSKQKEVPDLNVEGKNDVYKLVQERMDLYAGSCDENPNINMIGGIIYHNAQCANPFYHPAGLISTFGEDSHVPHDLLKKRGPSVCMQTNLYSNSELQLKDSDFKTPDARAKINELFKEYNYTRKGKEEEEEEGEEEDALNNVRYANVDDKDLSLSRRDIIGVYKNTKDLGRGNLHERYVVMAYVSARPDVEKEYRKKLSELLKEEKSLKNVANSRLVKNHQIYLKDRARALTYAFASVFKNKVRIKHTYAGPPTLEHYQPLLAVEDFMQVNNGLELVKYGKGTDKDKTTHEFDSNYVGKNVIASFSMTANPFSTTGKDEKVNDKVGKIMILCTPVDGYVTSKVDKDQLPGYGMGMSMSKFHQCPYTVTSEEVDPKVLETHVPRQNANGEDVINPKWKSGLYMNTVETFFDSKENSKWRAGLIEESVKYWKPVVVKQAMMQG